MSSNNTSVTSPDVSSEKFVGRVKWFNNKAGYGFISITDGPSSGTDVFVHHSSVNVESEQYKYLVQGEYVEFQLKAMENSSHEHQATNVKGIKGGKLMCETRRDVRTARNEYRTTHQPAQQDVVQVTKPKSVRPPSRPSKGNNGVQRPRKQTTNNKKADNNQK
jgi:CspA family cold shock protein